MCLILSLRTSEINEVELANSNMILAVQELAAFNRDGEDRMRSRGVLVHRSRTDSSILSAVKQLLPQFLLVVNHESGEILHVDPRAGLLTELEFLL